MVLTKIKKEIYHLSDFMKMQEKEIEVNKVLFYKSYEKIVKKFMKIYKSYFYSGPKEIQEFWLQFIREMDKEMEKALKSAVKNSLVDLQKHIKGEMQEIVPIFRIYTIISNGSSGNNDADWMVVNDPSHLQLKTSISDFIQLIIKSTSVVPRLEAVFRHQHA